ncbi:K02A2.6-like [Cordylochernes scorpioides]|uniref:K02A2.6-like n=1 Tax=Cordylochernes scorpioides TaxID=51811 RepID=A0ABY6LTP1_9ARAC|nr:K02A2.6-like [Cordylochernes scorpioides]
MKDQPNYTIIQGIKLHLDPKKKVIPQLCRFLKRIQQEGESISEYLRELKHLSINCNLGDMQGTMLRDRFVAGINSESLQKKLLQEYDVVTLDKAYLQVILAEEAKAVVNINTTKGLFSYKRLPYGVAVASNKFQRIMEGLFADLPGVACYIDDILVAGKDFEYHEQKLDLVFRRLLEKGLKLNRDKCRFKMDSVEYLGFKIDEYGLHPLENKIKAVIKGPEPKECFAIEIFHRTLNLLFSIHKESSRIKRWSLKLTAFNYTVEFRKTSDNFNVDALSRLPLESSIRESLDEDQVLLLRKLNEVPFSFREVAYETSRDKILSIVLRNVREGNCVKIHKSTEGIDSNIEELTRECRVCQESASMPPATISEWIRPEKPWHRLHLDLAGPFKGRMFLVLVDAYSKWIEIFILKDITSKTIRSHLREIFARFGLSEFLVTNNGRQFVSGEFEQFIKVNVIRHTKTSPYNSSTNGLAERYSIPPQLVIKESSAELLMKRSLRSRFSNLIPKMGNPREVFHEAVRRKEQFTTGCEVYFRNYATGPKWKKCTILKLLRCRHYLIDCEGLVYKRHIIQLRPKESEEEVPEVTSGNEEETAAVHVPSRTPRPGSAAVQVPSCSPKPETATVQVSSAVLDLRVPGTPQTDWNTHTHSDAAALGAFCRRLTSENAVGFGAESAPSSSSLAAAEVLRGTATPFLNGLTTRSARRALDCPRLAATPISRFTSRWSPTIGPLPSRIDWASLRRCAYSGHEADAALKLALHALPHPAHPASESPRSDATVPERPSTGSHTGAELAPKNEFEMNFSKENSNLKSQRDANSPAGDVHVNPAAARDVTAPPTAASSSATTASPASLNWADSEMVDVDDNKGFTVVKNKKRRRTSTTPERAAKQPSRPAEKPSSQQLRRPTGPKTVPPREIKATRANIADAKKRQATTDHEHYIFVERCPEIPDYTYLKAMSRLVGGPDKITHFGKMNGHFLVGLATKDLARLLVESDFEIGGTTLRVFPYRKRAERIVVAGLPGFVDDFTIVNALGQYGRVTSIAPILIKLGEFAFNDGRREAFILLHEGVRLETLPARLTIQSKGDTLSAYLSFGIKCSKCGRQGHRRASCPSLARRNFDAPKRVDNPAQVQVSPSPPVPKRTGPPTPVSSPPAPPAPSEEAPNNAPVTPAAAAPGAPALHPARPLLPPGEAPSSTCSASNPPTTPALPSPAPVEPMEVERIEEEGTGSTQEGRNKIRKELDACLQQAPSTIFDKTNQEGLEKERVCRLLVSTPLLKKQLPNLKPAQRTAVCELVEALLRPALPPSRDIIIGFTIASINARGLAIRNKSLSLCHLLRQHRVDIALVQETNTHHLDGAQDLCLGYDAITAPPDAISGSGLACIYAPGITVSRHRILWPGHIVLATLNVHGQEMTVINVHLSHDQRERIEQLRVIEAAAVEEEEEAWVHGDFNIRDDRNRDSISMAALGALCESAALLDAAPEFDAAHLPTRVAAHGDLIESSRLDRILAPARFLEVSTSYAIAPFHLSDHRMVLLRVGPPAAPYQPRVAATLRSGLAQEHMNNYLVDIAEEISMLDAPQLWNRWTLIKAGILAEARSLHDPRHHDRDDSYIGRAQRYIRVQLEASSTNADYPSLSDLARLTRHRRPAVTTIRDENGEVIEGPVLRRKALDIFRPRFARPSCDPAEYAAFIGATTTTPIELGEEDPLHRAEVSEAEVAAAIRRLPRGRAPGWDGLPCEVLSTFEEFFAVALRRVLAESQLRGALPPSMRRSEICLVPKARGGGDRGLDGYRPISLPSADYRVIGSILLGRLRPHLPTLVPECQTYAVPGRSPSWNIARVTDAVEEATARGTPLAAVSVDLQSAFDSLDRGYLTSLLVSHLRLPPAFVGWILLLYAGADATIRVGGFQTVAFRLLNGVRQGCALSAALFSIATGPLLRRLETILGVGNVIAYADDIVLLIHRDEQFARAAAIFESFHRASGIAVNYSKSAGIWCGAWRDRGDSPLRGASWSNSSIQVLGTRIATRSSVVQREQHLLALLESACRRTTPFTRGLSLVGRARAANSLVLSTIQHHLHAYLPEASIISKLQARVARFIWGPDHTAWLASGILARPVVTGGLGLIDIGTQLHLACLKGVQVALRGGRNGFSWLVTSEAWFRPPPDGTTLQPRRLRLLKLWEETSGVLSLDHRAAPTTQLLDLPIIGGFRFLRPPNLLAPSRWVGARVRDLGDDDHHTIVIPHPTRSALADAAALAAFCRRIVAENIQASYRVPSLAEAVVLRGTTKPLAHITTRSARRALDRPRLAALPIHRLLARWTPTVDVPPRVDWTSLRRGALSGHNADVALRLALHALPHPDHPASAGPSCPACGSSDGSLGHRYWGCRTIRPLILEAFNIIGRPPDLQAWIFGTGLEQDDISILSSAKSRVYRHFIQVGLLGSAEDPVIAWHRTLARWGRLPG